MVQFKGCPRCQGDMHTNRDIYGEYRECLQCGHMVNLVKTGRAREITVPRTKKKAA